MPEKGSRTGTGVPMRVAIFLFILTAGLPAVFAAGVTVTGGYGFVIDQSDLSGGAGSNFNPGHSSPVDAILVTLDGMVDDLDAWQIMVRKENSLWQGGLGLGLLRTAAGTGTGTISGGDVLPLALTATDQVFFEGAGNRNAIPVQLMLDGVSVLIPADAYAATLVFTIVDI